MYEAYRHKNNDKAAAGKFVELSKAETKIIFNQEAAQVFELIE